MAEQWGLDPLAFLRLPRPARRFCEAYLIAKGMKQEASRDASEKKAKMQSFDQQAASWAEEVKRQYKVR